MLELGAELADDGARPDERHLDLAQQRAHLVRVRVRVTVRVRVRVRVRVMARVRGRVRGRVTAHLAAAYDPKGARPLALPLQRLAEVRLQRVLAEGRSHAAQLRVAPPLARPLGQG